MPKKGPKELPVTDSKRDSEIGVNPSSDNENDAAPSSEHNSEREKKNKNKLTIVTIEVPNKNESNENDDNALQKAKELEAAKQKALEEEAAKQKALEEEAAKQKALEEEAAKQKALEEEAAKQKALEEEAAKQKALEEEAAKQKALEEERQKAEEAQQKAEEAQQKAEKEAQKAKEEALEEAAKQKALEAARRKAEEVERKHREAKAAKKRQEAEEKVINDQYEKLIRSTKKLSEDFPQGMSDALIKFAADLRKDRLDSQDESQKQQIDLMYTDVNQLIENINNLKNQFPEKIEPRLEMQIRNQYIKGLKNIFAGFLDKYTQDNTYSRYFGEIAEIVNTLKVEDENKSEQEDKPLTKLAEAVKKFRDNKIYSVIQGQDQDPNLHQAFCEKLEELQQKLDKSKSKTAKEISAHTLDLLADWEKLDTKFRSKLQIENLRLRETEGRFLNEDEYAKIYNEYKQQKLDRLKNYEDSFKATNGWRIFGKALLVLLVAAVGFIVGAALGVGIGFAIGAFTGPGAFVTAALGFVIGGYQGGGMAITAITAGAAGAGILTSIGTGFGLFSSPMRNKAKSVVKAGDELMQSDANTFSPNYRR